MTREELKQLIINNYYDSVNGKVKTRIIPDNIKTKICEHTKFYNNTEKSHINVRCYFIINDVYQLNTCINCGCEIHPISVSRYNTQEYCGSKCSNSHKNKIQKTKQIHLQKYGVEVATQSPEIREKIKQTNIDRYGVDNAFKNESIREKAKQTIIERYGVDNVFKSHTVREKAKQTAIERYGVDNVMKLESIRDKIRETNIQKYGVDYGFQDDNIKTKIYETNIQRYGHKVPSQSPEIQEKIRETNIERYGVENPFNSPEIQEKIRETNIQKYGVENPFNSPEIQNRIRETNIERYGVENPFNSPEIQNRIRETNVEKYGVENLFNSPEIQEKIKQTNIERYGVENPFNSPEIQNRIRETNIERYGVETPFNSPEIQNRIRETNIERYGTPFSNQKYYTEKAIDTINYKDKFCDFIKDKTAYEISNELGVHISTIYKTISKYDAGELYKKRGPSYLETQMAQFLNENNITYELNNRTILDGKELDFYIPEYNIAIEMNGVYYHSDAFINDKYYHYNKWKICNDKNIHLVSVFEDDWNLQCDKIKNMLLTFFNKKQRGIPARKAKIKRINGRTARHFLDKYHLQRYVAGTHYGAFDKDNNLISVMTFGTTRNGRFELKRFVMDNYNHPGLFSKIFSYAQGDLQFSEVVSFSDNTCFTGNVYKTNGFNFIGILKPDYRYLFNAKRTHKSNFTKKNIKTKFPELKEMLDNDGISEREALELLGIPRIWDCGKCEWVWKTP